MTIDITKPVRLVEGHNPVRVLCDDAPGMFPLVGYFVTRMGDRVLASWTRDGICSMAGARIENVPGKRLGYLNIYRNTDCVVLHSTRESADESAVEGRIACVEVIYEEGEGL